MIALAIAAGAVLITSTVTVSMAQSGESVAQSVGKSRKFMDYENGVFRVMTGFHIFHALVIGGYIWWVQRRAAAGVYGSQDSWDVEAGAKLWYFVVAAWIMFYVALYML